MTSPTSVMAPLTGVLTAAQIRAIKHRYVKLVEELADAWMTVDRVKTPYGVLLLWCVAAKNS